MSSTAAASESSPLRIETSRAERIVERWRLDWRTFAYVFGSVLLALAVLAALRNTSSMLTRISIGVLIALALDPVTTALQRRFRLSRGLAVAVVGVLVVGVAAAVIGVLGPRAVAEVEQFSRQFPETVAELERLPLAGDWFQEQRIAERAEEWVDDLPEQFTDQRLGDTAGTLVNGVVSVAVVALVALAVLVDGEDLVQRLRRLMHPNRREQADEVGRVIYRTLGRYVGGSLTVALMMGLFVLAVGLILEIPLVPLAAIWAMLTDLIPQVGGALGGVVFVILAATESVPTAVLAGALFVTYMTIENHVIQPAIVGRSVDLTAPTTMVAALIGGAVAGVPGALIATPAVGAAKQLVLEARGRRRPLKSRDNTNDGLDVEPRG